MLIKKNSHSRVLQRVGYEERISLFATLGYRFIGRTELDVVRERIRNPGCIDNLRFRVVLRKPAEVPRLMHINDPEPFRSYAMIYGRNVVCLPRYADSALYTRFGAQPAGEVMFTGDTYPWPTQPEFLHDRSATPSV